jgi:hypothetical protein
MASLFHYGPYVYVGPWGQGLPPGGRHDWVFGPWPWYAYAVTITAHPFFLSGADRTLAVTSVSSRAAPDGNRYIYCTIQNVGNDPANYAVWLGGVAP